ncbi:tetratricopeptide repeat-containing protein [Octadecabacter antarcticus 307]|uniref:Tetratricopeptide repeat-containing protein n=1 Tax=Octadecabacter antarcticus 307 TaxID=391626 RepID=M9R009_9RHOB|nr:tetratricopeptide repeat protein [Octadecabacter antarcticus]AGI65934.1 tetratricopeptide repeat-containing protein [Octadecabacter antarcticus 307]
MIFRIPPALRLTVCAATLALAMPAAAAPNAGAYLAARQAAISGDYAAAAIYFRDALLADANNTALMEQSLTAFLGVGQVESAAGIARPFINAGGESQIANIALMAQAARAQDWDTIFDLLEAGHEVGPLLDGLVQAWAYLGNGDKDGAMMRFDEVVDTPGLRGFGQQHKALALAMSGDLGGANAIYDLPPNIGIVPTRASVVAHLQILAQLGEFERAGDIIERAFGEDPDPELVALRSAIMAGAVPDLSRVVATPSDGIAYAYKGLSEILQGEANESYLLLYAQAARFIAPHDADAQIATARLQNALGQYDAAAQTFAQVVTDDPAFHSAEIGRAESLRLAGRFDQAIEVLSQLTRSHPDLPLSYASLGDVFRQQEQFEDAAAAYSSALSGYPEDASIRWWLLYSRGITNERLDEWDAAEADFRASLALNPGHPSVLNYLGYSLVVRGLKFDEALGMIETAVAARPDNGAIVDSLAWVYYKLGRYQDAVAPMERAAELEPNDPIISDHLGDVYWMVGRKIEARFQWRRALSFEPEQAEATRIRRKLSIGLESVYAEDGVTHATAVEMANDDN